MKTIFIYLALLTSFLGFSQTPFTQQEIQYSPGGKFDKVFDHYGNEYSLENMKIDTVSPNKKSVSFPNECNSGYFKLYFEDESGFELEFDTDHIQRRAVLCQLFYDLSQFIIPANLNTPVNIWVRNFNHDSQNPPPTGALGYASSTYMFPPVINPAIGGGIVDNAIWKTINSGIDAFQDVAVPLSPTSSSLGFYHGMIAFDFESFLWLTELQTNNYPSDINLRYDLYTVGLHEITHALGFASLINEFGMSKFGSNYPYFSRFDKFLQTTSGTNLITNTGSCGSLYNFIFNPSLNLSVLISDGANCATTDLVKFGGSVNQNIYTNPDFEDGSSLSHLEDQCHLPNSMPDNEYYVMSEGNGLGTTFIKRFLKPEERNVCAI